MLHTKHNIFKHKTYIFVDTFHLLYTINVVITYLIVLSFIVYSRINCKGSRSNVNYARRRFLIIFYYSTVTFTHPLELLILLCQRFCWVVLRVLMYCDFLGILRPGGILVLVLTFLLLLCGVALLVSNVSLLPGTGSNVGSKG